MVERFDLALPGCPHLVGKARRATHRALKRIFMDTYNDSMVYGEDAHGSQDSRGSNDIELQQTQQASQLLDVSIDAHLWGYLQPLNPALARLDFWKIRPRYTIGRAPASNDVVFPGPIISNEHCTLVWDGGENAQSTALIHDHSANGTFINGESIGYGRTRIIHHEDEIAFGTPIPMQTSYNGGISDYRFKFHHVAAHVCLDGIHVYYLVGGVLGEGTYATVRKAINRSSHHVFAVKMIQEKKFRQHNGDSTSANLAREISILEKLNHPNICALHEVYFQANNDINLVLELAEGGNLFEYSYKRGGLSETIAKHITYQICDALAYVHSLGITHRDIKPENILLTKDDPPVVKVADFGLAKVFDNATRLKTLCGTRVYMAPEVFKQNNRNGYNNLVDSWSVGVVVFGMLANASPFTDRNEILEHTILWSALYASNVTPGAIEFVRHLLRNDPRQRMSLTEALEHTWLLPCGPRTPSGSAAAEPSNRQCNNGVRAKLSTLLEEVCEDANVDNFTARTPPNRGRASAIRDEDRSSGTPRRSARLGARQG
ncbi:kinase-like domain-containing protein [Crassisporium funariophilum]|nr:kinase-like domain-containing protein [Crassisporium funariophilum]